MIRKELEHILKKQGKLDEVQQLDTNALNKILLDNKWDEDLLKMIKDYVEYSESKRLYLSKKKD